jgi:hypothetical protein
MFSKHVFILLSTGCFLGLLGLALFAGSCGRTHASPVLEAEGPLPPPASMDVVMKAVRDYGRGQTGVFSPTSDTMPVELDEAYSAQISKLLDQEDFAQLEKIAQQNRTDKGRLLGGVWKTFAFYEGLGQPTDAKEKKEVHYALQIKRTKKWIAAYPDSTAARLALAHIYLSYGWGARGTDYADKVSESQWKEFGSGSAHARALLLEASSLKERDPAWYYMMQQVATAEGWDKAFARELFDQATAFEPGYYHYYRLYANYLLPQWYGEPGELLAFADEVSSRVPDPQASMLYSYTVGTITCYCQEDMQELPKVSYAKAKQGYDYISRFYGVSNLNANRLALLAFTFQDQASARDAFALVYKRDPNVWPSEDSFNWVRQWAAAQ